MQSVEKNQKIAADRDYVRKIIEHTAPGDPLPSFRSMMEAGNLTRTYLEKALEYFSARHEITAKSRSGIYRNADVRQECRIVDLIACNERNYLGAARDEFFPELLENLYGTATRWNCAIRLHRVKETEMLDAYRELTTLPDSNGYFLIRVHSETLVEWFEATGKPVVYLFPTIRLARGRRLEDNPDVIPTLCRKLETLGHSRVAYLNECDPASESYFQNIRRDQFNEFARTHGWEMQPEWNLYGKINSRGTSEVLETMFFRRKAPGALIANDRYMPTIYQFLDRHGLRIGRDITLLGYDGLSVIHSLFPTLTSLASSRKEMAETAWNLFWEKTDAPQTVVYPSLSWMEGGSPASREG